MSTPYIGEIRMFGGNFAPVGWLFCNGQSLPIDQYDTLFNLIGTTYGGDGQTSFNLPNLQGRLPLHVGPGYVLGQSAGTETVTLLGNQLPFHNHTYRAVTAGANTNSPAGALPATTSFNIYQNTSTAPTTVMNGLGITSAGGSQPHDNVMPFLAVNFIISTEGIYPSAT